MTIGKPFTILTLSLLSAGVLAEESTSKPGPDEWRFNLGAGVGVAPEYRGADTYKAIPIPVVEARLGRLFINPITGIGWNVVRTEQLTISPVISYERGRDDVGDISELDKVDDGAMAGVLLSWTPGPWQFNTELATPVAGDLEGIRLRSYLRYRGRLSPQWSYGFGPGATWANEKWNDVLFGVSDAEATRSGLAAYDPDGAFLRASVNGRLTYHVTPEWNVSSIARYSRLFGDAADSPIVSDVGDANQWFGSLIVTYSF